MRTLRKEAGFCYRNLSVSSCLLVLFTLTHLTLASYSPALAIIIAGPNGFGFVGTGARAAGGIGNNDGVVVSYDSDIPDRNFGGSAVTSSSTVMFSDASGAGNIVSNDETVAFFSSSATASPNSLDAFVNGGFTEGILSLNSSVLWDMRAAGFADWFDTISVVGPPDLSFTETLHFSLSNVIPTPPRPPDCVFFFGCGSNLHAMWSINSGSFGAGIHCGDDRVNIFNRPCAASYDLSITLPVTVGDVITIHELLEVSLVLTCDININCNVSSSGGTRGTQFLLFDPPPSGVSFVSASGATYIPASDTPPNAVPEPSTWLLLSSGLAGLAAWKWRRDRA